MDLNNQLLQMQNEWNKVVVEPFFEKNNNYNLSRPYYMGLSSEYINSNKRIMIIGQETQGFGLYEDDWSMLSIHEWSIGYLRRQLWGIDKEKYSYNRSAFWKLFRSFEKYGYTPCWNNIDKIQRTINNKTVSLTYELEEHFCKQYGQDNKSLIQREIEICKPNVLLFITGPYYDFSMETSFGLEKGTLQKYRPTKDNLFSDVTDVFNLGIKVIWTYHPTFLNRNHKIDNCINDIVNAIK